MFKTFSKPISFATFFIWLSVIVSSPKIILFFNVSFKIYGVCEIYEIFFLTSCILTSWIFFPPIVIFPLFIGYNLIRIFARVVFPTPVFPAIVTLFPSFITKEILCNTLFSPYCIQTFSNSISPFKSSTTSPFWISSFPFSFNNLFILFNDILADCISSNCVNISFNGALHFCI